MLTCPQCHHESVDLSSSVPCGTCGFTPAVMAGFEAWAPDFATQDPGYDPVHYAHLAELEARNFWFRARNRLIIWALRKYVPSSGDADMSFLEIGCGTGFVLSGVAETFPAWALTGAEIFPAGLVFAHQRLPQARLVQLDARTMPYRAEFDVVAAFDVLEHIREDEVALRALHAALRPGGRILVAVPQHPWLWSEMDEVGHHVRRYRRGEMEAKMRAGGFTIERSTSFVSLLLPAMLLSRLRMRQQGLDDPYIEFRLGRGLNRCLEYILAIEQWLIRVGFDLPLGGSRFVVARRS